VSVEVSAWVWQNVHLEGDPVAKLVLLILADQANTDGTAAWPSQALLAKKADVSARTVRTKLRKLEELGLIVPGDQQMLAHIRADRRPTVYDVNMRAEISSGRKQASGREEVREETDFRPSATLRPEAALPYDRKLSSYKPSLTTQKKPTGSDAPAQPVDNSAQNLVAEWVDHCNGGRPPGRVIGQVAREIGAMLTEGIPYADVRAGLQQWHTQGLHPSTLASVVHEIRNPKKANGAKHLQPAEDARSLRLRSTPDPIPPPDLTPAETNRWLRDARRRIAAGEKP
jgi:hypothetical protein